MVRLRPRTLQCASDAQGALGELNMAAMGLHNRSRWADSVMQLEMRYSAAHDGVITLTREAQAVGLRGAVLPVADERLSRYLKSSQLGVDAAKRGRPTEMMLLERLSAALTGAAEGEAPPWREQPWWQGGLRPEHAYLAAAPPGTNLQEMATRWCTWYNEQQDMMAVVKITLAYFLLTTIAPFPGSGHLARGMLTTELIRLGVLRDPVLPISKWLCQHRIALPDLIRGVIERNDLDALVIFVARGIHTICNEEVTRINSAKSAFDELLDRFARKGSMTTLLKALVINPVTNHAKIAETCNVTTGHAMSMARKLQKAGVVQILDARTLEHQSEYNAYGKVIFAPDFMRRLGLSLPSLYEHYPDDLD